MRQPLREQVHGAASVADAVFVGLGGLGKGFVQVIGQKQGVIAKTTRAAAFGRDPPQIGATFTVIPSSMSTMPCSARIWCDSSTTADAPLSN